MINRRGFLGLVMAAIAAPFLPKPKLLFRREAFSDVCVTFTRGDIFTIEGVYGVHPLTYQTLPHLKQFVVTETVTDAPELPFEVIWPKLTTSGPYQTVAGDGLEAINWKRHSIPSARIKPYVVGKCLTLGLGDINR